MSLKLTNVLKFLFLLITISYAHVFLSLDMGSYIFWSIISIFMLGLIIYLKPIYFNQEDSQLIWPIKVYLLWNLLTIIRGLFIAENYWEWKNLFATSLIMMVPLFIYVSTNKLLMQQIIKFWLKYALLLFFLFLPFITQSDFTGRYLVIIMFLLLFFPILPFKWKIIVLFYTYLVFHSGLDARSDIIRFSMAAFLGLLYYIRVFIQDKIIYLLHFLLIILPIILLLFGLLNIFNVFNMDKYINGNYVVTGIENGKLHKQSLTTDTRTFIYIETLTSAVKNNYILEGRTPANGYDSNHFGGYLQWTLGTGKKQRFASEVSILNIFTWTGLIGVIMYFIVFLRASYLAIYKSNSFFMKIIGLFVAFRWSYAFVEDFTKFEFLYVFLWMLIGMCYSTEFRNMNNTEFKEWVLGLLPNITYK